MLEQNHPQLSITKQCTLLSLNRSSFYYKAIEADNGKIANKIHEIYTDSECRYGYRKITASLKRSGYPINHKKVLTLMNQMNIEGLYPTKKIRTTIANDNKKYPYLLKNVDIIKPNQVWSTDITYIMLPKGFVYFIAIIDVFSRYILSYKLCISMEAENCCEVLEMALSKGVVPEYFNSDQGSQFTSQKFIDILDEHKIKISMSGKGRCFDNIHIERLWRTIKQDDAYYYRYQTVVEARKNLSNFVYWYNNKRLHQSLNYCTPAEYYDYNGRLIAASHTLC